MGSLFITYLYIRIRVRDGSRDYREERGRIASVGQVNNVKKIQIEWRHES